MTRLKLLVGVALVAAACSTATPSPRPSTTATGSASAPGPTAAPTSTVRPTPTPVVGVGICPTDSPLTVGQFMDADPACFGGGQFEIRGWLDSPPGTGLEPPLIEPGWLLFPGPTVTALWEVPPVEPDGFCARGVVPCWWTFIYVNPASGLTLDFPPRWMKVTGHLNDPAAATCQFVYPEGWTEPPLDDALAVAECSGNFVIDAFVDAP